MSLYSATIILILVLNPLGNIPVFLVELKNVAPERLNYVIARETFIAFLALIFFMFFGQYILNGFQISREALGIAGGIILFLIALRMMFPKEADVEPRHTTKEPFIVPLAIPLTAGPAAMTTVMLFITEEPDKKLLWLLAITIASMVVGLIIYSARYVSKALGKSGLIAMERLMGMLLMAMSVQMFLSGWDAYFMLH